MRGNEATGNSGANDKYPAILEACKSVLVGTVRGRDLWLAPTCVVFTKDLHLSSKKKNQSINKTNRFYS